MTLDVPIGLSTRKLAEHCSVWMAVYVDQGQQRHHDAQGDPSSTPNVSSPAMTITAVAKVQRLRTNRALRYLGFVRCNIAAMTMAASAGCGIFRNRGVSRMSVKKQKAGAIRLATWLRAPAAMATEVFDRLPTTRNPPKRPLNIFAGPCATNSWFGLMSPPLCMAAAFAAPSASA